VATTLQKPRRKPPPFRLIAPVIREFALHVQIARVLELELARAGHLSPSGVMWFSVEHANFAGVPGTRSARGVIAGCPDVQILYRGRAYFLELKAEDGRLSKAQKEIHGALIAAGCQVAVARNAEEVLGAIDAWGIPRAHRTAL
jgi:hypothetical protein